MDARAKVVEGFSAKISGFKAKRNVAHAEAEQAAERIEELNDRRAALFSGTFSGERGVTEALTMLIEDLVEALSQEAATFSCT